MVSKKKFYTIYSDMHIGGPHQKNVLGKIEDIKFTKETVFLGDNFDFQHTKRRELEKAKEFRKKLAEKVKRAKGIFLDGNHERSPLKKETAHKIREGVLFLHGDIIQWGVKKAKRRRERNPRGNSNLIWGLLFAYRQIFKGNKEGLKEREIERAIKIAKKFDCHTIILGHFHPKNLIVIVKDGIRIIVVPRGVSNIEI